MAATNVQAFSGDVEISGDGRSILTFRMPTMPNGTSNTSKMTFTDQFLNFKCIVTDYRDSDGSESVTREEFHVTYHNTTSAPVISNKTYTTQNIAVNIVPLPAKFFFDSATKTFTIQFVRQSGSTGSVFPRITLMGLVNMPTLTSDTSTPPGVEILTSEGVNVIDGGNVGIGTTNPEAPLHLSTSGELPDSISHKYLGVGSASTTDYVTLLQPNTTSQRLIGTVYGVRTGTALSNTFEAKVIIGTGGDSTIDAAGLTFKYIGSETFYGKLVTLTYDGNSYIALQLTPGSSRGMTGGIYFEGKTSQVDKIQLVSTVTDVVDYTPIETVKTTFSGNVGIGTTNPLEKLDVRGTIIAPVVAYSGDQDAPYLIAGTGLYTGASTNWGTRGFQHRIKSDSGGIPRITVDTPSGGEGFTIVNGGNVGIGITNPFTTLHVASSNFISDSIGPASSSNNVIRVTSTEVDSTLLIGASATGSYISSFSKATFSTSRNLILNARGGNVGIGLTDPIVNFEVNDGSRLGVDVSDADHVIIGNKYSTDDSLSLISYGDINICSDANGNSTGKNISFRTNTFTDGGSLLMRIKDDGNVGIGLTNPGTIGSTNYPDVAPVLHLMGPIYQSETSDNETWALKIISNDYYFQISLNGVPLENVARINYINGAYVDLVTFTGQHRAAHINDIPPNRCIDYEGLIVSADRNQYESVNGDKSRGIKAITVNEAVPLLSLSKVAYDKKCFGIVSASEDPDTRTQSFGNLKTYHYKEPGDTFIFTNSVGEGAIWVVNTNGSLESGDYITTSNVAGYGQRQDSEFLANYTVAKITMDCDFEPVTQPIQVIKREMGNVDYWIKKTITNISSDDYSKLADEYRATDTEIYYSNETGEISVEKYNTLEPDVQSTYTELTRTIYQEINIVTSKKNEDGHDILEVRQEMVNVLDEHGQLQWEDDPSGATEKAYKIRYLDADGNITDEANHVYKAAFVGCTYHCG